jgi:hypothetical protein
VSKLLRSSRKSQLSINLSGAGLMLGRPGANPSGGPCFSDNRRSISIIGSDRGKHDGGGMPLRLHDQYRIILLGVVPSWRPRRLRKSG